MGHMLADHAVDGGQCACTTSASTSSTPRSSSRWTARGLHGAVRAPRPDVQDAAALPRAAADRKDVKTLIVEMTKAAMGDPKVQEWAEAKEKEAEAQAA